MLIAVGVPIGQGGSWLGWLVVVVAAGTIVLLLHPAVTATLEPDRES